MDVILVTDPELRRLKREWFGIDRATDVVAFDDGEIYISVDTARRQADERGIGLGDEILRLAVHGTVHIMGYDDSDIRRFCRMREKEWEMLIECLVV